ncbi:hypothetical protein BDW60DRAFT_184246 [Aspergillus nidulans var. acristatus]
MWVIITIISGFLRLASAFLRVCGQHRAVEPAVLPSIAPRPEASLRPSGPQRLAGPSGALISKEPRYASTDARLIGLGQLPTSSFLALAHSVFAGLRREHGYWLAI